MISMILATDMARHTQMMVQLKQILDNFEISNGLNLDKYIEGNNKFSSQQTFMNLIVHSADIGVPVKPFEVSVKWIDLLMEEFWRQGDFEK